MEPTEISEVAEVTPEVLGLAEDAEDGWYPGQMDWDSFWDRLEDYGVSILDPDSPAARKIQRHIREIRKEQR